MRLELGCPSRHAAATSEDSTSANEAATGIRNGRLVTKAGLSKPGMRCHWSTNREVRLEIRSKERALMLYFAAHDESGTLQHYKAACKLKHVVGHVLLENDEAARDEYALNLVLSCPPQLFRNDAASGGYLEVIDDPYGGPSAFLWVADGLRDREQWSRTTDFSAYGVFGSCLLYRIKLSASQVST